MAIPLIPLCAFIASYMVNKKILLWPQGLTVIASMGNGNPEVPR